MALDLVSPRARYVLNVSRPSCALPALSIPRRFPICLFPLTSSSLFVSNQRRVRTKSATGVTREQPKLLYSSDPIVFSVGGKPPREWNSSDGITNSTTDDITTAVLPYSSSSSSRSSFTPEHVRNLADAAGSPVLEMSLRMAAAEQLHEVLLAPGVALAVRMYDGEASAGRGKVQGEDKREVSCEPMA